MLTKAVHRQIAQWHTLVLTPPTQIGNRVHGQRPASSRIPPIDTGLHRIHHRQQRRYDLTPMTLGLPRRNLDEWLLVRATCTHRKILGTTSFKVDPSCLLTVPLLRQIVTTMTAVGTLTCRSMSQKGLGVVMACRQEPVLVRRPAVEVRSEAKPSAVPREGPDNFHCI
jgi:hypothetical protein